MRQYVRTVLYCAAVALYLIRRSPTCLLVEYWILLKLFPSIPPSQSLSSRRAAISFIPRLFTLLKTDHMTISAQVGVVSEPLYRWIYQELLAPLNSLNMLILRRTLTGCPHVEPISFNATLTGLKLGAFLISMLTLKIVPKTASEFQLPEDTAAFKEGKQDL